MTINTKYSMNGYNPLSEVVINKKKVLADLFEKRILNRKEYSKKCTEMKLMWKGKSLLNVDASELNNTEVVKSNFSQKEPFTDVFPPEMTGVTFINCNLDNCNIPDGNIVQGGTNKHFKEQNDGEYWIVDKDLNPIAPLSERMFDDLGISKNPVDIPKEKTEPISIIKLKEQDKLKRKASIVDLVNDSSKLDEYIEKGGCL